MSADVSETTKRTEQKPQLEHFKLLYSCVCATVPDHVFAFKSLNANKIQFHIPLFLCTKTSNIVTRLFNMISVLQ